MHLVKNWSGLQTSFYEQVNSNSKRWSDFPKNDYKLKLIQVSCVCQFIVCWHIFIEWYVGKPTLNQCFLIFIPFV